MFFYEPDAIQITAIAATLAAILIIVGLFVYNHAAGMQVKTLKSIDEKLTERTADETVKTEEPAPETVAAAAAEGPEAETSGPEYEEISDMFYNVGRSGRAYTKEELELQIKE